MQIEDNSFRNKVQKYYHHTANSYRRWGLDPENSELYSLHFGLTDGMDELTSDDNHNAIKRLTTEVLHRASIKEGMTILDAGCGTGTFAYQVTEDYPSTKVFGVNVSPDQLECAVQSNSSNQENPYFSIQDYHQLSF